MWTLYAGFAYILAAMILTFVTGWQNWGPIEGSVVAGGPVLYVYTLLFQVTNLTLQTLRHPLRAHELLRLPHSQHRDLPQEAEQGTRRYHRAPEGSNQVQLYPTIAREIWSIAQET